MLIVVLALIFFVAGSAQGCTTLMAGRGATVDGSVLVSHSNDGGGRTDPRLVFIPEAYPSSGSLRPIFASPENYPRYVGYDRGIPQYFPVDGQKSMQPIGFIPQVNHTFKFYEQTYGAMNEHQVGIGESTCSCIDWTKLGGIPTRTCTNASDHDCALLSIDQLSQIAMERSTSSREAVTIIGQLAEEYGFYGEGSFEGSAESLLIADPHEGWIFHVLAHPNGRSAIWAAQRLPDDHVTVVANMFIIRNVNLSDTTQFLGSADMADVARLYNLSATCPSTTNCDFTGTFSDGEYAHMYYSGRRMWRALSLLSPASAPSLNPNYKNLKLDKPYPVTLAVDPTKTGHRIDVSSFFAVHRDHYEGTEFDMTKHMAAGPFGTPNRDGGGKGEAIVKGNWERAISIPRISDSQVVQARSFLPNEIGGVLWFGSHVPHVTAYTPFPAGLNALPESFSIGHQAVFNDKTMYWASRYVGTLLDVKYSYMIDDVRTVQSRLLNVSATLLAQYQHQYMSMDVNTDNNKDDVDNNKVLSNNMTADFVNHADHTMQAYWDLFNYLMFKYADGFVNEPVLGETVGYPAWWLLEVGYQNGPGPV